MMTLLAGCGKEPVKTPDDPDGKPGIDGMIVWSQYNTMPENDDSSIMIYDLKNDRLKKYTHWRLKNPLYANFSPDAENIVFMARPREGGTWNVYMFSVRNGGSPVNLTPEAVEDCREPRFSPDGKKIVFAQGGRLAEIDLGNENKITVLTDDADVCSMPCYDSAGGAIVYVKGAGAQSSVALYDISAGTPQELYAAAGVPVTFPVTAGSDGFYYNRTVSTTNSREQVWKGLFGKQTAEKLPFNADNAAYADAVSAGEGYLLLSSTRSGSSGGYDLWLLDEAKGEFHNLAEYNTGINTSRQERFAHYTALNVAISDNTVDPIEPGGPSFNVCGDTELRPLDTFSDFHDDGRPKLYGKLMFHNYDSYSYAQPMTSTVWMYDFWKNELTKISSGWDTATKSPMNQHWSPDGKYITFMGQRGGISSVVWDIFLWEAGSKNPPVNLTGGAGDWDEDPKFSYASDKVVFKRSGQTLYVYDLVSKTTSRLTPESLDGDFHMPYFLPGDRKVLYSTDKDSDPGIWLYDIETQKTKQVANLPGIDYYPIGRDDKSFYFSAHYTGSATTNSDQLFMGYYDGSAPLKMAWNSNNTDTSDACYVSQEWVMVCSVRSGGQGQYDYYIAKVSGNSSDAAKIWNLNEYCPAGKKINTGLNELGASYLPSRLMYENGEWVETPPGTYWNSDDK